MEEAKRSVGCWVMSCINDDLFLGHYSMPPHTHMSRDAQAMLTIANTTPHTSASLALSSFQSSSLSNPIAYHTYPTSTTPSQFPSPPSHASQQQFSPEPKWNLDSGASHDVTNLTSTQIYNDFDKVMVGNGKHLLISHIGSNVFPSNHLKNKSLVLKNILHVPDIAKNLLRV